MDYDDAIYDQPNNDLFSDKIEQLQYKACLAIIGASQGTSQKCLSNDIKLESLSSKTWCRKICAIYKQLSTQFPRYLSDIKPSTIIEKIFADNSFVFPIKQCCVTFTRVYSLLPFHNIVNGEGENKCL